MDDLIAAFSAGFSFISLSLFFFVFGGSFKKKREFLRLGARFCVDIVLWIVGGV